ncbi:hypothetical protein BKA64DRAFT_718224 [Cadophora sp. MPI-SDFR-AT-0126]|nr:hypothetical protein BKA64DRAFT_718224 [Leotiomycetes sp. MPI-SDFR-AT-0126]
MSTDVRFGRRPSPQPKSRKIAKTAPIPRATFIGNSLDNELVTIYVGPCRKGFLLHKKLLCKSSDFFGKAFNSGFQEAQEVSSLFCRDFIFDMGNLSEKDHLLTPVGILHCEGISTCQIQDSMYLAEESPDAFAIFVNWLYRSTIDEVNSQSNLYKLVDAYILADKICMVSFQDAIMDPIQDISRKHTLGHEIFFPLLEKMSKYNLPHQGLTKFCVCVVVDSFIEQHGKENTDRTRISVKKDDMKNVWTMCRDNFDLFHYFLSRLEFLTAAGIKNDNCWNPRVRKESRKGNRCFSHCHDDLLDCRAKDAAFDEMEFLNDEVSEVV